MSLDHEARFEIDATPGAVVVIFKVAQVKFVIRNSHCRATVGADDLDRKIRLEAVIEVDVAHVWTLLPPGPYPHLKITLLFLQSTRISAGW